MTSTGPQAVSSEAGHSLRHAGLLAAQRGLDLLGAALFAVLVPRLMGPELFGRYALIVSVSMWFSQLSGLGAVSLVTRAVPTFVANGDMTGLRTLVTSLLALRAMTGTVAALIFVAVMALAFRAVDPVAVVLVALAIACRTVGNLCFALFLGLNRAAKWGAGDVLRRWLVLGFILVGAPLGGVRGACAGWLLAQIVVLAVGLVQARAFLAWSRIDLGRAHLAPYLRIGTAFAVGNLLIALTHRSGEAVVQAATNDFAAVGFYGAAYAIYLAAAQTLWQTGMAFGPWLVARVDDGPSGVVAAALERLCGVTMALAVPAATAVLVFADDLVPALMGARFAPVATALVPLGLALVPLALNNTGRLAALAYDRPGVSAGAAACELLTFWALGLAFVPRWGGAGLATAALAASCVYAVVITLVGRGAAGYSLKPALLGLACGFVFVPSWLAASPLMSVVGWVVGAGAYVFLLDRLGIVTRADLWALRRALRPAPGDQGRAPSAERREPWA